MKLHTAIYARVSTKDKGQDPEMQLHHLRKYAKSRGLSIYKEYVDRGASGAKEQRPALDALMAAARRRQFDTILVFRFDRFARSVPHLIKALEEFNHLGIDFISFTENIDTSSPMGKMVYTLLGAVAQLQRDIISENVKKGLERARANGKVVGRPKTSVDVEEVKKLRASGVSFRMIAEKLGVKKSTVFNALQKV